MNLENKNRKQKSSFIINEEDLKGRALFPSFYESKN